MIFDQTGFDIRCEWGANGIAALASTSDAVIIVDIISFSTAVTIATARGAVVYPYHLRGEQAQAFAQSVNAELAGRWGYEGYSLSPASLLTIPAGTRLVLPSLNGATLTLATGGKPTFAGCLRNAAAVARAASRHGPRIAVIPCGERWKEDGRLRPAIEDLIGAGAIISHLPGSWSPEAQTAVAAYHGAEAKLLNTLQQCASGREIQAMGFAADIHLTAQVDVDDCAPFLSDGAYTRFS